MRSLSGSVARSWAAWAISAMKKRPKISVPLSFSRSLAVLIRITLPAFISVNRSSLERGCENIRSKVWFSRMPHSRRSTWVLVWANSLRAEFGFEEVLGACPRAWRCVRQTRTSPFGSIRFAKRVDGGIGDVQHQPGDIAEDHVLLLGHLGGEQRAEHEVIELEDRVGQPLAIELRSSWSSRSMADIEQVERHRPFDVVRIDDDNPVVQRLTRRKDFEPRDLVDQVALAVDDDDRALSPFDGLQVFGDQVLQGLGLAVAGAGDDVMVFEPDLIRNGDLDHAVKQVRDRCATEIGFDQLVWILNA